MSQASKHTLYICYFGLREPLVQTQVLPYLREITKLENLTVSLLTFEPNFGTQWTPEQIKTERQKLAEDSIAWHCLPYHKNPSSLATIYDTLNCARFLTGLSREKKIDILHARAHIPVLMALITSKFTKSQIIFDIRGLMAEEYADAGVWQEKSKPFNFIKYVERKGIKAASQIVVLTKKFQEYVIGNKLKEPKRIEVIPCCVDFSRIAQYSNEDTKNSRFELIYAGSATGLYLLREMGSFFLELKKNRPKAFFRILTASDPKIIQNTFNELGINNNDYEIAKVLPAEVPKYLKRAHLGISFRKPTFSQIAASPTKIPEYLASGLPVISNSGIGDMDELIEKEQVGAILQKFDSQDYQSALKKIEILLQKQELSAHCQKIASEFFDLEKVGGLRYRRMYQRLLEEVPNK